MFSPGAVQDYIFGQFGHELVHFSSNLDAALVNGDSSHIADEILRNEQDFTHSNYDTVSASRILLETETKLITRRIVFRRNGLLWDFALDVSLCEEFPPRCLNELPY